MEPGSLPIGTVWNGINVIDIAGVISCRPGYRCIAKLPKGNLQGLTIFRPIVGLEQAMAAVDGRIYVAEYPFTNFRVLDGVAFSPFAKQIFWSQTTQAARRLTTDFTSAIEVISPRAVMIMQDGGFTAPAYYDGASSGHIRNAPFETPVGSSMQWVGDRLWVAQGNKLFASDIANPFSFREDIYLGGSSYFEFKADITAMIVTPGLEFPQLLVFTADSMSIVEASIRNRNLWPTTDGFQRQVLAVGAVSNRAVSSHFGRIIWLSPSGVVFFDPATSRGWTSRSPLRDNEMLFSKDTLSQDVSLSAMGTYGQWLLLSVPAEDQWNKHTWVLNNASWETISDEGGPTWNGFWLGTRPVEWVSCEIAGTERIYHVSFDADEENRLWEAFVPDRLDNGCPIMWAIETRGHFGLTATPPQKPPGFPCRYNFADVAIAAADEDIDVGVFVAPGTRGTYRRIMAKKVAVEKGNLSFDREIDANSSLYAFKGQSRILRTEDFQQLNSDAEASCPVESNINDEVAENFQLLIVGHGPASLRWIRSFATFTSDEDMSGEPGACESETGFNAVRFDGEGARSEIELASRPLERFTATKTATVEQGGFFAVGTGFSESVVSQATADRVAEIIATKQADMELQSVLPPVLSLG